MNRKRSENNSTSSLDPVHKVRVVTSNQAKREASIRGELCKTEGNITEIQLGQKKMKNAILSAVLIFISYWIANTMPTEANALLVWLSIMCLISGILGVMAGVSAVCDL